MPHSPIPSAAPAHLQLRAETAEAHRQLDHRPLLKELLSPHLTTATYAAVLRIFHGFYCAYEAQLALSCDWATFGLSWQGRAKLPLLERDLAYLQRHHPVSGEPPPVSAYSALDLTDPASAFGLLYVMEGSTLGGRVIARCVAASLGFDAERGAAYFHSYGPLVGQRWKETQAAIDACQQQGGAVAAMIASAQSAFADLAQALT